MRFVLPSPRQPQSIVARIGASILAVACLALLVVFGALALAILVGVGIVGGIAGYIWLRWRLHRLRKQAGEQDRAQDPATPVDPNVIEGEYVVVDKRHDDAH